MNFLFRNFPKQIFIVFLKNRKMVYIRPHTPRLSSPFSHHSIRYTANNYYCNSSICWPLFCVKHQAYIPRVLGSNWNHWSGKRLYFFVSPSLCTVHCAYIFFVCEFNYCVLNDLRLKNDCVGVCSEFLLFTQHLNVFEWEKHWRI